MSGLGSQRSGAVLLAGLANGPRTHPWPAGLEVRFLPAWLGDRQTGQSGVLCWWPWLAIKRSLNWPC